MNTDIARLAIIAALSLAVALVLCYGALRTAERIARRQIDQQNSLNVE